MAEYTPNLNLLKKDPATDGNDTFNIKTMLNDNWDKIDVFSQAIEEGLGNVDDVELAVSNLIEQVGNLEEVNTETKLNLVAAINEVYRKFNEHKADYAYQTPTIVGTQIRISKQSNTDRLYFRLDNTLIGSSITISLDGGISELPLKDVEGNNVTELEKGFVEVVAEANFFTLRPRGGKKIDDVDYTITSQGGQFVIPKGQHSGNGVVKALFPNLVAENIKKGVNIGGVVGSFDFKNSVLGINKKFQFTQYSPQDLLLYTSSIDIPALTNVKPCFTLGLTCTRDSGVEFITSVRCKLRLKKSNGELIFEIPNIELNTEDSIVSNDISSSYHYNTRHSIPSGTYTMEVYINKSGYTGCLLYTSPSPRD